MKGSLITLILLTFITLLFDQVAPFASENFNALLSALVFGSIYGHIALGAYEKGESQVNKIGRSIVIIIALFFCYKAVINVVALIDSLFNYNEAYKRFRAITSNYYTDVLIAILFIIALIYVARKPIIKIIKKRWRRILHG